MFSVCRDDRHFSKELYVKCLDSHFQRSIKNICFVDSGPLPGLLPNHKQSILLFLDRVYGIDSQEMIMHFLEQSFLPDLRAATMMDSPRALESDTALALNRYLCNSVLPLLTNHSHYFAEAEHHAALLDATLHTVKTLFLICPKI